MGIRDFVRKEETARDGSARRVVRIGENSGRSKSREVGQTHRNLVRMHSSLGQFTSDSFQ